MTWFDTSYHYKKQITLSHAQVSGGSNLSNFPVLISQVDPDLKTEAHGGKVQNASGYDIIFTDSTETVKLDHEIENYIASSGEIEMWVRIPTLSASADTIIYMYLDNSTISSSQANPTGVWDSNYISVYHLAGPGPSTADSTSNANTGTNHGVLPVAGQIAGGASFDGSSQYIDCGAATDFDITAAITLSAWINDQNISQAWQGIVGKQTGSTGYYQLVLEATTRQPALWLNISGYGWSGAIRSSTTLTQGAWYYIVGTYDGTIATIFVNGSLNSASYGNALISSPTTPVYIGQNNNSYFNGDEDEIRISNVARSAGWIMTEYNNQRSPGTFYSCGPLITEQISLSLTWTWITRDLQATWKTRDDRATWKARG